MRTVFVVGNKFSDFSRHVDVIAIGELERLIREDELHRLPRGCQLQAGQGVHENDLRALCEPAAGLLRERGIDARPLLSRQTRASLTQTHKHRPENRIISTPVRVGTNVFEATLMVDERSELMCDHQTGQHIQGMVLIEAARQLFLAVTEEFFVEGAEGGPFYFVIDSLEVKFLSFVFPVEATLHYEIASARVDGHARMRFDSTVSVIQGGRNAASITFRFTAHPSGRIEEREHQLAAELLARERERLAAMREAVGEPQTGRRQAAPLPAMA